MRRCSGSDNALDTLAGGISHLRRSLSSIRRKRKPSGSGGSGVESGHLSPRIHQPLRGVRSNPVGNTFTYER